MALLIYELLSSALGRTHILQAKLQRNGSHQFDLLNDTIYKQEVNFLEKGLAQGMPEAFLPYQGQSPWFRVWISASV